MNATVTEAKAIVAAGRVELHNYNQVYVDGNLVRCTKWSKLLLKEMGWR